MITRPCTNSANLMIKTQQDAVTNKSKTSETSGLHLYALLSHQAVSVMAPIFCFPQVGLCEASGSDVPVKLELVRNSQSSYFCPCLLYLYSKFRPPKWRVLHEIEGNNNSKMKSQPSNMVKLSLPSLIDVRIHLTFIGN